MSRCCTSGWRGKTWARPWRWPARLADTQAALLAASLPNPRRLHPDDPSDYVRERQRWIITQIRRLRREGWITRLDP